MTSRIKKRRLISNKIRELRQKGKTQKEAVAIALSMFPKPKKLPLA
tara:strand:+ start:2647 stop:2784 length:138 start_codon:yes stop_codon:yes gene_type:complete